MPPPSAEYGPERSRKARNGGDYYAIPRVFPVATTVERAFAPGTGRHGFRCDWWQLGGMPCALLSRPACDARLPCS